MKKILKIFYIWLAKPQQTSGKTGSMLLKIIKNSCKIFKWSK